MEYLNEECIGIEIGTSNGTETEEYILKNKMLHFYSIDSYENNLSEYKQALIRLDPYKDKHSLFRMNQMEAVDMFPDHFFNILILNTKIDGVIEQWLSKMKPDGIILGDFIGEEAKYIEKLCSEYRFVLHTIDKVWFVKLDETQSFSKMMGMLEL